MRRAGLAGLALLAGLAGLGGLGGARLQAQGKGPGFSVGILPFQDVSGNADLGQLSSVLASMLQNELLDKTQLVPRQLAGAPGQAVDIATAAGMGQQAGTDVVAIGTLLSGSVQTSQGSFNGPSFGPIHVQANRNQMKVVVLLQVALVDANRGVTIATLRAKGNDSVTHLDPSVDSNYGTMNMQGAGFQNTVLARATKSALDQLAGEMNQALGRFTPAAPAAPPAAGAAPAAAAAAPSPAAASAAAAAAAGGDAGQPDLKAVKIDFVPGEKTIFYDDFSDMAAGEPPPHWQMRGDAASLLSGGGVRELQLHISQLTSPRLAVPANFTLQTVARFQQAGSSGAGANWHFLAAGGQMGLEIDTTANQGPKTLELYVRDGNGVLGDVNAANVDFSKPVEMDVWAQNGRLRAYVNGTRVMDENGVTLPPIVRLGLHSNSRAGEKETVGVRLVRLAESAPDFSQEILATGKYVSHGIHFDSNSAILKPESAPFLREVAEALATDPNLKLEIDGYTDSVGDPQHNLALSQQRAAAVRGVLVAQFGIDGGRLTTAGMGAADPLGSNDTAAGRADNRRVEFLKK
ncbi:MAG TPA: OmpA family protein [Terriglobales bacterium]|nr:OmpA family protein [Terriglobales bacterium]